MKSAKKSIYYLLCIVIATSCVEDNSDVQLILQKAASNYPINDYGWFNAPPRIDFILLIRNPSKRNIALPLSEKNSEASQYEMTVDIECSPKIVLHKITGNDYSLVKAGDSTFIAVTGNPTAIQHAKEVCNIEYYGELLKTVGESGQIVFKTLRTDQKGITIDGTYYHIPKDLVAFRTTKFEYEAPETPVEE